MKRFCSHPFNKAHLTLSGDVYVCCSEWLNHPIGNVFKEPFEKIWNSSTAREIRQSILEESFKFCRKDNCPRIVSGLVEKVPDAEYRNIITKKKIVLDRGPELLSLNYDNSCNLFCESCRDKVKVFGKERSEKLIQFQGSMIKSQLFKQAKRLTISGTGEVFSSRVYLDLFNNIRRDNFPELRITLRTNGLLLTPANWERLKNVHYAIDSISISIDAATKKTYEILRRGGDFKKLMKNLSFLKELKKQRPLTVRLNFVVQKINYREMPKFVKLAKKFNCDHIAFSKIFNLGTYKHEDYKTVAVHEPDNPEFARFKKVLRHSLLQEPMVHFRNLANLLD